MRSINGVTITANRLELNENGSGIVSFGNLQIVNGGQTTNTIFRAKYLQKIDISKVFVPAKICVLDEERADELAPGLPNSPINSPLYRIPILHPAIRFISNSRHSLVGYTHLCLWRAG